MRDSYDASLRYEILILRVSGCLGSSFTLPHSMWQDLGRALEPRRRQLLGSAPWLLLDEAIAIVAVIDVAFADTIVDLFYGTGNPRIR
jgi:hypothetical protein